MKRGTVILKYVNVQKYLLTKAFIKYDYLLLRGKLTAEVFANYLRHECLADCAFLSENASCQQAAGTLSEEDTGLLKLCHNKSQDAGSSAA